MVIIISASVIVQLAGGLPGRIPPDARIVYAGAYDFDPRQEVCEGRLPEDGLCQIGRRDAPGEGRAILLWGDSHAGAVTPGLDTVLAGMGLSGAAAFKNACPPLLNVRRADLPAGGDCVRFNAAVLAMLRERSDFQTVILSARWALAAEGDRISREGQPPAVLRYVGANPDGAEINGNFEVFDRAFSETIRAVRDTGRKVIVLESWPEVGWHVPEVLGNSIFIGARLPDPPSIVDVEARNVRVDSVFDREMQDQGIERVNLASHLCKPDCVISKDGRPLYYDDDHLSIFGATVIIEEAMAGILQGSCRTSAEEG